MDEHGMKCPLYPLEKTLLYLASSKLVSSCTRCNYCGYTFFSLLFRKEVSILFSERLIGPTLASSLKCLINVLTIIIKWITMLKHAECWDNRTCDKILVRESDCRQNRGVITNLCRPLARLTSAARISDDLLLILLKYNQCAG